MTITDSRKMKCGLSVRLGKGYSVTRDNWVIAFRALWNSVVPNISFCTTWEIEEGPVGHEQVIARKMCEY